MSLLTRLKHSWDAFRSRDPTNANGPFIPGGESANPNRIRMAITNERSIITAIYNRMAIDVAAIAIRHVRVDQNGTYMEDIDSSLNKRLNYSPNIDQTPRAFMQDVVLSMFDEGYISIFPAEADYDILEHASYQIFQLRKGRIREWFPNAVRLEGYWEKDGRMHEIIMPKERVAIIENPLYVVMNGPNSTLQRLIHKLSLLDAIDNSTASGKLDVIIQLPYGIRNEMQEKRAEARRKSIEMQLTGSKYGIAYADATERITQLNRPVENNLLSQVEYLRTELFSQLGLTPGIFDGTASEQEQLNYNNRTLEPIVANIAAELKRKFLTKTAISQGQSIMYFRDPFKLAPVSQIAEIADKFIRNEILSPNEMRALLGFKPSTDPKADELRNPNIAAAKQDVTTEEQPEENQNESEEET